jgi:hypothetical protein
MQKGISAAVLTATILLSSLLAASASSSAHNIKKPRNVIIFIADGLRPGSVNSTDAPTLLNVREHGVNFVNSHALFPTFTTPNASAIATSHYLGDTGDFSNAIYAGFPIFNTGNFGRTPGTNTPFIENDPILGDLDAHFSGNFLTEESLLEAARQHGFNTATVGKHGPAAIQDVSQLNPVGGTFQTPTTVFIDDATGTANGVPLPPGIITALTTAGLPTASPSRSNGCGSTDPCNNGFSGNNETPGTTSANLVQQQYFTDATTKAILPAFKANGNPFVLVFWSRDPDGTQHNQGDSLNTLVPGINGATSKASVKNADNNLKQILEYINSDPELAANTDIFVTADHGFATISRHETDAEGHATSSYAASFVYKDISSRQDVNTGFLPSGFLAIDLAHALNLPLFDPDSIITDGGGNPVYQPVDPTIGQQTAAVRQHPAFSDGVIGGSGKILDQTDAKVIVAANGGSDLIYIPDHDFDTAKKVVAFLSKQDYTGGLFVDDSFGEIPGALPLSSINLVGATPVPTPSIVITFKTFATDSHNPNMTAVQIADTSLQQGQGMHGTLARDNTFNNMAAIGPDFKKSYVDRAPVSNADIARTFAHLLGFRLDSSGDLKGRILWEALQGGPNHVDSDRKTVISARAVSGKRTALEFQKVGKTLYFDQACLVHASWSSNPCR